MLATANMGFGGGEMLQIADAVAREKGIGRDSVLEAMEQAIQVAARRKYGHEHNIGAEIDRKTGVIQLYKITEVVEGEPENEVQQIRLKDAKKIDPHLEVGSFIRDPLPPIDFGRIAAQTAKQVIVYKVRDAERDRQYEEYKDRVDEIISGVVKRVEYGNVTVEIGRTEATVRREEVIPRETFRAGDRIRAYVMDVRREKSGPQIFLSRTHPNFMAKLFAQEVPEIYDGIIEIKAVARDPGSRAKIAVISHDSSIDPVGSCVGVRGSRVQAVVGELQGERVDIIQWSPDTATFIVNALAPAEVTKVVIDEDTRRMEVVVPDEQLSLAIGRRGQNVRLASQLTGWEIDVLSEDEESNRRLAEFNQLTQLFMDALNVEEVIAQLLATEGFGSVEEIAYVPVEELAGVEGFDASIAEALHTRAREYLEMKAQQVQEAIKKLKLASDLVEFMDGKTDLLIALGEKGIRTKDDFADLARDEFQEIVPNSGLSDEEIDALIMQARESWFADEAENAENGEKQA